MARITPDVLRTLRQLRRFTLDQLAEKSKVDKQTIHRLERGHHGQTRASTLTKLAKALGVEPEILTGPIPGEQDSIPAWEPNKSQLNLRISAQVRNALLLVGQRYQVKPAQIVELAPLLFNWAAEKCLTKHQERVESLKQRESEILEDIERFTGEMNDIEDGPPLEIEWPDMSEAWGNLDFGIHFRELFNEFGYSGPITHLLRELASEIGDQAEFVKWYSNSSPTYSLCKEEASWLANGDEVALENILQGHAPLNELPSEFWEQLRNRGGFWLGPDVEAEHQRQALKRVEWLRAHGKPDSNDESEAVS